MDLQLCAQKLEGLCTAATLAKKLGINERTAINYAWKLRKAGYLKTAYGGSKVRIYRVSPLRKKIVGYSFYELLNKYSKIKLTAREDYIIHADREPSVEEILARAVVHDSFRVVLASLSLFNKIRDWTRLKKFADVYASGRKIGALYDVARTFMRVRRMDERTRRGLRHGKRGYIIEGVKSKHFQDIEKEWGVFIPFNKADLARYKE